MATKIVGRCGTAMKTVVVFVEEPSAEIVVLDLAKRFIPHAAVSVIPHSGKTDLKNSFPKKIGAWVHPRDAKFIILHDNDGANCKKLKSRLMSYVPGEKKNRCWVRIVVQELESWYLGDLYALSKAGLMTDGQVNALVRKSKFREPDRLGNAKQEFMKLHDLVGQRLLARQIAPHLDPQRSSSPSFKLFVETLKKLSQ